MDPVLADLLSQSPERVWTSAGLINHTRDGELLSTLAAALPEIQQATESLNLGGMLFRNQGHLHQAIRVIKNYRSGKCFCRVYPGYVFYDPSAEQEAGYVRIIRSDPPDWNMTYDCICTICRRAYSVEQGEYHYTWWAWRAMKSATRK